ncbi:sialic acid-binding Ig-like lectin 5 [Myotis daubentonii]|uniref:sialic acid-binding Ig-like lectin 5 n=1 Tax=Myotis daubentonii TaxID=98922 RepID=UPI002872B3FE|nr:sialic acid-binding Ig-like lectin 5 [Myotis daubentonii]
MVPLLLLPLLWGGSLQQQPGYELQVQESVTVHEGLCVHVPCSFSYPRSSWSSYSKVYTYWYRDGDKTASAAPVASSNRNKQVKTETKGRFLLADPKTNNCSLQIREARRSDSGRYFFRVERGTQVKYSYQDKMLDLQVTDKPHIQVQEPLESGRRTQVACSLPGACERGQCFTFSWAGAAVVSLNTPNLSSSVLTFTPRPWDHGTNLTCQVQVQQPLLTTQRTIRLNVSYAAQNLTIGVSFRNVTALKILQTTSLYILKGEALRLLCEADSNPPAELSWFRGSPGLNATPLSSTAILELPSVGPAQAGEFTCQARHPLGSHSVSLSLSVAYPLQLLGPSCSWEDQGLHCSCSSRAQPAPSLRWRLGTGLLEGNHGNGSQVVTSISEGPWTNSSLILHEGLSPDLRLSCEARNVHGAQSASVLLLPGKAVPQAGVVPAALGGAGAMALLSLCLCLIIFCIVKARRRQAAGRPKVRNDEDPVMGTVTWGSQERLGPGRPPDQAPPAEDAPPSGEQQEVYYANLSFYEMRTRESQNLEATGSPEYSEIKRAAK